MPPILCAHCANIFMKSTTENEANNLCNNCFLREELRNKKPEEITTIGILIQLPRELQIEIEEICINQGVDFSKYFINLHENKLLEKTKMIEASCENAIKELSSYEDPYYEESKKQVEESYEKSLNKKKGKK